MRSGLGKSAPDFHLDSRSISLVDAGSVGNLPDYADIAKRLNTPWCAVSDEDKAPGGAVNPVTEGVRKKVEAARSAADLCTIWSGNLEACLGTPAGQKATPEWQAANTDPKPLAALEKDHPDFVATCRTVHAWLQ
jgi:hypothetical protein